MNVVYQIANLAQLLMMLAKNTQTANCKLRWTSVCHLCKTHVNLNFNHFLCMAKCNLLWTKCVWVRQMTVQRSCITTWCEFCCKKRKKEKTIKYKNGTHQNVSSLTINWTILFYMLNQINYVLCAPNNRTHWL